MPPAKAKPVLVDLDLDEIPQATEPSFTFKVGGKTFRCRNRDDLHWDTVEKWLIAREVGGAADIAVNIDGFFRAVIFPEDIDAFMEMKYDPKGPMTVARSEKLLRQLNEQLFGVPDTVDPTTPPAPSGRGSRANGTGSRGTQDGRATTTA